jgi:hypothetical protein
LVLCGKGPHKGPSGEAERHQQKADLHLNPVDFDLGVSPVDLKFLSRAESKRCRDSLCPSFQDSQLPNQSPDRGLAALERLFFLKPLKDPQRGVALLSRRRLVSNDYLMCEFANRGRHNRTGAAYFQRVLRFCAVPFIESLADGLSVVPELAG